MTEQLSQTAQQLSNLYDYDAALDRATSASIVFHSAEGRKVVDFTVDAAEMARLRALVRASLKADIADIRAQIDDLDKNPKGRKV